MPTNAVQRGILYMAVYSVLQALTWGLVRYLGEDMSTASIFFFRNLIGLMTILPLFMREGPALFKTTKFALHGLRAAVAFIGGFAVFYAVAHAPLASVISITFAAPIFASLFAMMVFGEGITLHRIMVLAVGFVGVIMVLRPSFDIEFGGMVGAVIATIATAAAFLSVKRLSLTERSQTVVAYPFLLILPLSALLAYFDWTSPSWQQMPVVVLMGLGISAAQYCLVKAFSLADASAVLPIDFLRLIVAGVLGYFFFGDAIDTEVFVGAAVILAVTIYSARKEKEKAAQAAELADVKP